jgi:hypothetical protein
LRKPLSFFSNNGHVVLPSGEDSQHLIQGNPKPIPIKTFLAGLLHAEVDYVRLINFGMKQQIEDLPPPPPRTKRKISY